MDRSSLHVLPARHALSKGVTDTKAADEAADLEETILAEADMPPKAKGMIWQCANVLQRWWRLSRAMLLEASSQVILSMYLGDSHLLRIICALMMQHPPPL